MLYPCCKGEAGAAGGPVRSHARPSCGAFHRRRLGRWGQNSKQTRNSRALGYRLRARKLRVMLRERGSALHTLPLPLWCTWRGGGNTEHHEADRFLCNLLIFSVDVYSQLECEFLIGSSGRAVRRRKRVLKDQQTILRVSAAPLGRRVCGNRYEGRRKEKGCFIPAARGKQAPREGLCARMRGPRAARPVEVSMKRAGIEPRSCPPFLAFFFLHVPSVELRGPSCKMFGRVDEANAAVVSPRGATRRCDAPPSAMLVWPGVATPALLAPAGAPFEWDARWAGGLPESSISHRETTISHRKTTISYRETPISHRGSSISYLDRRFLIGDVIANFRIGDRLFPNGIVDFPPGSSISHRNHRFTIGKQ